MTDWKKARTEIKLLQSDVRALRMEIDELKRIERAALSLVTRDDFWRNAGTLPGEYDNLRDALGMKGRP